MEKEDKKNSKVKFVKKKALFHRYPSGIYLIIDSRPNITNLIYLQKFKDHCEIIDFTHKVIPLDKNQNQSISDLIVEFRIKNGITKEKVILNLASAQEVSIGTLISPKMSPPELISAARIQLIEDVPFNLEKAEIYPEILYQFKDQSEEEKIRTLFYIVNKVSLDKYIKIIQDLQLNLVGISTDAINFPCLINVNRDKEEIYTVLNIDYKDATLYYYSGKKLLFVRPIAFSWQKLARALMGGISLPDGNVVLTFEEAEEFSHTIGLSQDENIKFKEKIPLSQMMSLIRPLLELVVRELKYSLRYFDLNFENKKPEILYLTGGGASLKNIDQYIQEAIGIKVVLLRPPLTIEVNKSKTPFTDQYGDKFLASLGSTLHTNDSLNFIPKEIKTKRLIFIQKWALVSIYVVMIGFLIFSLVKQHQKMKIIQKNILTDKEMFDGLRNVVSLQEKVLDRRKIIRGIHQYEVLPEGILLVLSDIIPDEIKLEMLVIQRNNFVLRFSGNVVGDSIKAEKILNDFVKKLEGVKFFNNASLVFSQRKDNVLTFEIKATLAHE